MAEKRWKIKPKATAEIVEQLSVALGIDLILANLLATRYINTFDEAKYFFRPLITNLHDPFLMKDMDKAITRIEEAIQHDEKILVFGDYDVDGTTAVSLVYTFLHTYYNNVEYYIPDRYKEGYGISTQGIDFAAENNFKLIIALDCGIKANEKIEHASKKGVDFIICDHHLPGDEIPKAVAVLDPKRKDCKYPFKELSGCGIGFKLIQAYAQKNNIPFEELEQYLDLVAVSIAADIVPVNGENRILAYYGIIRFNTNPRAGFKAMLELASVKRQLTISDLVFIIGPRINAAGRIESGNKAVELLTSKTAAHATASGQSINITNNERRNLDAVITQEAFSMIDENEELIKRKSTVLFNPGWHKGVIGIVASRLTEKYYRPTIVLTESNGMVTGSARSVKDYDIYEAIDACSDLLVQFGGHKFAAGLTLKPENVIAFQNKFEKVVSQTIADHMLIPEIEIDDEICFEKITPKFLRILKQFAPFGPENMSPVFLTKNVIDNGNIRIVGSNHLKLELIEKNNPSQVYPAIAFGLGHHFNKIYQRIPFDVCYSIEEHEWNGNVNLQLSVKDIKFN